MNKILYILHYFILNLLFCDSFTHEAYAQVNLITNGDFELYDTCPDNFSQLERAIDWIVPTTGTSDYFNQCAYISWNAPGVPDNFMGSQYAYDGFGYGGFYVYQAALNYAFNYREYIQTKLTQPMISGRKYEIGFYVSLSDNSKYASYQIGAYLSSNPINSNTNQVLEAIPQIENPIDSFVTDTAKWTLIKGFYTALGGEQYITIGNFFYDSLNNDNVIEVPHSENALILSYYYVDGVYIFMDSELLLPNVITPNGDKTNDDLSFLGLGLIEIHCKIYNRWGNQVYEINNIDEEWEGKTKNGQSCSEGVYYYTLDAKGANNKGYNQSGFIQLYR